MDIIRKLASIKTITNIKPIEGADRIIVADLGGWQCVTQKDNNFKIGDLVCYFEIDSFLPVNPLFEFLRKSCYKNTTNLGEGFRIKTIKLKGQLSQGLILPISEITKHFNLTNNFKIGDDLTNLLNIKKYEKPIPAKLAGKIKGNFPSFLRKTDQERVQNLSNELNEHLDGEFEITIKLEGSSMTAYYKNATFGVCSRNLDLLEDPNNTFWNVARKLQLAEMLEQYHSKYGIEIAIQGELMGPGVQDNYDKLPDHQFYLFDIWNISAQEYFRPIERNRIVQELREFCPNLLTVPFIENKKLSDFIGSESLIQSILKYAEGPSLNTTKTREGIVFKHLAKPFSFKAISNLYLIGEK